MLFRLCVRSRPCSCLRERRQLTIMMRVEVERMFQSCLRKSPCFHGVQVPL